MNDILTIIDSNKCTRHKFVYVHDKDGKYHGKKQCIHCKLEANDDFIAGYEQGIKHAEKR